MNTRTWAQNLIESRIILFAGSSSAMLAARRNLLIAVQEEMFNIETCFAEAERYTLLAEEAKINYDYFAAANNHVKADIENLRSVLFASKARDCLATVEKSQQFIDACLTKERELQNLAH